MWETVPLSVQYCTSPRTCLFAVFTVLIVLPYPLIPTDSGRWTPTLHLIRLLPWKDYSTVFVTTSVELLYRTMKTMRLTYVGEGFRWNWSNIFRSNWKSFQFHSLCDVNHRRNYVDQKPVPNHKIWLHWDWKLNENLPQLNWNTPGRPFHFVPLAMRTDTCFYHLLQPTPPSIALSPILSLLLLSILSLYMPLCSIIHKDGMEDNSLESWPCEL